METCAPSQLPVLSSIVCAPHDLLVTGFILYSAEVLIKSFWNCFLFMAETNFTDSPHHISLQRCCHRSVHLISMIQHVPFYCPIRQGRSSSHK